MLAYSQPEDHVLVFSFYAVLNAAILGVAWFKTWPELNLLGLGFAFGITAFWLFERYTQDEWATTQPFVALFVLMYMVIPVLFAVREAPDVRGVVTAPLVFGTPFIGFGLQALIVGHTEYGLAISALVLAVINGVLALVTRRFGRDGDDLTEAYWALGVAFIAIAVPFALDAHYTATVWAFQGAVLVWIGTRRSSKLYMGGGALLQVMAGASFGVHLAEALPYLAGTTPIANEYFLGAAVVAASGLVSGWIFHRLKDHLHGLDLAAWAALAWGTLWWLLGGLMEIGYQVSTAPLAVSLVFVAISCGAGFLAAARLAWPDLNALGLLLLAAMVVALEIALVSQSHPLALYGWVAWLVAFAVYYAFLRLRESGFPPLLPILHAGAYWVLALLVGFEVFWQIDQIASGVWPIAAVFAALLVLVGGTLIGRRALTWPLEIHRRTYLDLCTGPVLSVLAVVVFLTNIVSNGDPSPIFYVPVLNPLEVLAVALVLVALLWKEMAASEGVRAFKGLVEAPWAPTLAVAGVVLLTMAVARTVHHWVGVPRSIRSRWPLPRPSKLRCPSCGLWPGWRAWSSGCARRCAWCGSAVRRSWESSWSSCFWSTSATREPLLAWCHSSVSACCS